MSFSRTLAPAQSSEGRGHRFESCRVRHRFAFCFKDLRPRQNSSHAEFPHKQIISKFGPANLRSSAVMQAAHTVFETLCLGTVG